MLKKPVVFKMKKGDKQNYFCKNLSPDEQSKNAICRDYVGTSSAYFLMKRSLLHL